MSLWPRNLCPGEDLLESHMRTDLSGLADKSNFPSAEYSNDHTPYLHEGKKYLWSAKVAVSFRVETSQTFIE